MKCRICDVCDGKTVKATYKAVDKTFKMLVPFLCTKHVIEVSEGNPLLYFEKIEVKK